MSFVNVASICIDSFFVVPEKLSVFTPSNYSRLQIEKWPRQDGLWRGTQDKLAEKEEDEVRRDIGYGDGNREIDIAEDREL